MDHSRTERPITIEKSIRFCYILILHYYRSAKLYVAENFTICYLPEVCLSNISNGTATSQGIEQQDV